MPLYSNVSDEQTEYWVGDLPVRGRTQTGPINLIDPPAELRAGNLARNKQIVRLTLLPQTAA